MELKEEDLKVEVYREEYNEYGQNLVNKSGVKIIHIPTGIKVSDCSTKSQIKNKQRCLQLLQDKINNII